MDLNENIDNLVNDYLKGKLSGKELADFQNTISENPELLKIIETERLLGKMLEQKELLDYKKTVLALHKKEIKNDKLQKILIGTSLGILLVIGGSIAYTNTNNTDAIVIKSNNSDTTVVEQKNSISTIKTEKPVGIVKTSTPRNDFDNYSLKKETKNPIGGVYDNNKKYNDTALQKELQSTSTIIDQTQQMETKSLPPKDVCNETIIKFTYQTVASCKNESNGGIIVENIQGGKKPYFVDIFKKDDSTKHTAAYLQHGVYLLKVHDSNACISNTYAITIGEKNCIQNVYLNAGISEMWKIPNEHKACELKIVDKTRNVYFSKQLAASDEFEWDGKSNLGVIKQGYYIFQISFIDGQLISGTITISE